MLLQIDSANAMRLTAASNWTDWGCTVCSHERHQCHHLFPTALQAKSQMQYMIAQSAHTSSASRVHAISSSFITRTGQITTTILIFIARQQLAHALGSVQHARSKQRDIWHLLCIICFKQSAGVAPVWRYHHNQSLPFLTTIY